MRRVALALLVSLMCGTAFAGSTSSIKSIGQVEDYRTVREDDTLIEIAYREDVGYVELRAANPHLDPWLPGSGEKVVLPKQHLIPDGPRGGILVNLGEMRLYYFPPKGPIQSYPLGIGREGLLTPKGSTTIVRKAIDPIWTPTPRMRREKPELDPVVGPGPENPMGPRAMYLGWPQYAIHGTNRPWGIGRRVSSGCMRMYNQDVKKLYNQINVGTPVSVVDQPVKSAWIDGVFYVEAHPNAAQADAIEHNDGSKIDYEVSESELNAIMRKAGAHKDEIDWSKVRKALRTRPSYPIAVSGTVEAMKSDTVEVQLVDAGAVRRDMPTDVETAKAEPTEPKEEAPAKKATESKDKAPDTKADAKDVKKDAKKKAATAPDKKTKVKQEAKKDEPVSEKPDQEPEKKFDFNA